MLNLYEIHILVSPEQEEKLSLYVSENKEYFKEIGAIRARKMTTVTSVGVNLRQPMLTFLIRRETFNQAVEVMNNVSEKLQNNFTIVRQKVEGNHSDKNIPSSVSGTEYYEFHTKILNVTDNQSWEKLARLCLPLRVPLLYNSNSNKIRPVTTLRCYDMTLLQAIEEQNNLENLLRYNGFILDTTDKEYSLFDNNLYTDKGWMFETDPKEFITYSDNPLTYNAPNNFELLVSV